MAVFQKAELILSAPSKKEWPNSDLPEIALAGRSNVGKSSFINTMTGRKKLALSMCRAMVMRIFPKGS